MKLIYSHCLIRFNITSENNDFGFNSIQTRGPEGPEASPDLLNNVKIGLGQLQLIMEQILFLPYTFWSSNLNNLMNYPSNSPVFSEKKMFRQVCGSPNEWPWIKGHRSA